MAPVAAKALYPSTPEQLELWKSMASWNEALSWSSDSSGIDTRCFVRASRVPTLRLEMEKWSFGKAAAIEKVSKLELDSKDKYIAGNHDAYERLWDEYHEMHDHKATGEDNRRREGVTLSGATMLYREVQTSLKAGEHEYDLQYPNPARNRLDSDRRALRFILVKRWRVLLRHVRSLLPDSYDPDKVKLAAEA
jgi:hypothetical protein